MSLYEIVERRKKKSENIINKNIIKSVINNIKTLYKSREKVIELFDDCSRLVSKPK